jgi:mono/diheme cytochrome c family protein
MGIARYLFALFFATIIATQAMAAPTVDKGTLARGKYLIAISGCNDCHTAGYPESGGKVPEVEWLTGNAVGFSGPWGTTYPANLRLTVQSVAVDGWIARARSEMRPPMPWFSLRDMSDADLRAVYHYIRSLGARGPVAPAYVPPGQKVATPYIEFVPKNLPRQVSAR